ncbi:MAG: hypothetical protein COB15_06500 [Flavobacteriales bacterium]|nr:MAG: hypothetical protein COB15_06500 [Flavobacteriales bacterium]
MTTKRKFPYRLVFFLLILQFTVLCKGQTAADKWFFGNGAGVDFSGPAPVGISGGQINTLEGVASISDANGNLLFYTEGDTIWNANHAVMTNGTGLMGDGWSSTQEAIIVQKPCSPNIYYVFTVAGFGDFSGFRYSEVDMTLSGGLGAVNGNKNVALVTPVLEKVSAVYHANGIDIWVVTHGLNNNNFHAFLVTSTGVNLTPVTSATGTTMNDYMGQMKLSPDGTKLALADRANSVSNLYDFDNATGIVSNELILTGTLPSPYGIEFSPNSQVLYISNNWLPREVYQYDLNAGDIPGSELLIGTGTVYQASLQLGPDNKIYIASYDAGYLGAIDNPNTVGLGCNYVSNAVSLSAGTTCRYGLPPFVRPLSPEMATSTAETCLGDNDGTITLIGIGCVGGFTYEIIGFPPQASGYFPGLAPATYNYTITDGLGAVSNGSITVNAGPICCVMTNTSDSTNLLCSGLCDGTITLTQNLGAVPVIFSIDNGTTTQSSGNFTGLCDGTYNILIEDGNGCQYTEIITLTEPPIITGTDVQVVCNSYTWHGITYNSSTNTPTFTETNIAGCDSIVTLDLTINNSNTGTDVQVACNSYTWHGTTYTSSTNTPIFTETNVAGCDSIVTLDLTINNVVNSTDVVIACVSYTWIDGNNYTTSNNTATQTLLGGSVNGCDSIVTLDLTINNSNTGTDVQVACNSYTWHGTMYTSSTNTPTFTEINAAGCDSIVTLDLTINNSNTGTDVQVACNSYTWHGTTYSSSTNTPTFTETNAAGCDSIVTLNLTINNVVNITDVQTSCDSYTWIDGNTYTSSTNTATFTISGGAANGCDSIVTLDLTINVGNVNAVDDYVTTSHNTGVQIDPLVNDLGSNLFTVMSNPINGITNGSIFYTPNPNYSGLDSMTYEICDLFCVTICDTAMIFIEITPERVIVIHNGFSPNGDGINDIFEIENIEFYPDNDLMIYNRWGDSVYGAQPYNNDWDGSSEATGIKLTGNKVTDGTYYYILKLTPESEPINGFIDLRR